MTKRHKIDKSVLTFGIPERIKDDAYRKSFEGEECVICQRTDTTVGAHIRTGHEGGTSLKPTDPLMLPLCGPHHADQEANPGPGWWIRNLPVWFLIAAIKEYARKRYWDWKNG